MDGGSTALAHRETVVELVRAFERAEADIRKGFGLVNGATEVLRARFGSVDVRRRGDRDYFGWNDVDDVMENVRRQCWARLIERLELRRFCSIKKWDELQEQLNGLGSDVPEITVEMVMQMADGFRAQLSTFAEEKIKEVYDWLRPHHSRYKTNSEFRVGKRVVLAYALEYWGSGRWFVSSGTSQHLNALDSVFQMLDGQGTVSAGHYGSIEEAIRALPPGAPCKGETKYFKFRGFRNRNLHIEIKREDLLLRFNQIAGGSLLAGARGEASWLTLRAELERARNGAASFTAADADFFETPDELADRAVMELDLRDGMAVLEPSAGTGALVRALIRRRDELTIDAWEINAERAAALCARELASGLRSGGLNPVHGDFLLKAPPSGELDRFFDCAVMNPPFSKRQDILHVAHALEFLKPGGVLVAIMSASVAFRKDALATEFRDLVAANSGTIESLPEGLFREAGTMVRTVLVRMVRK